MYWGGSGRTPINRQALDNFSFVHGNHSFKTGANIRWYSIDQFRRATNFYPRLTFGTGNAPVIAEYQQLVVNVEPGRNQLRTT